MLLAYKYKEKCQNWNLSNTNNVGDEILSNVY